jgi:integrase
MTKNTRHLKYINSYRDRHGKLRYYFRRAGCKKISLPLPGSPEFLDAYKAALEQSATPMMPSEIGASRTRPGTVGAVVAAYFASREFKELADTTKSVRRSVMERFRTDYGDGPIKTLRRVDIEKMLARQSTAATALHLYAAIRVLMQFSVRLGLRSDDPTVGIRRPKLKGDGVYSWSDEDIARFEATHPIGSRAHLALLLGLFTGQRRSDIIALGWQHIRSDPQNPGRYILRLRQRKTGATLDIPIHTRLQEALDQLPRTQLTFLVTQYGRPFGAAFGDWFRSEVRKAGLPRKASFHGLRKAAARRLAEAGCSASVISAVTGHQSLREVERYVKGADQLRLARQGIGIIA